MTKLSQTQIEARKLFNDVLATERKTLNIGARLAITMHQAITLGEIDATNVKAFGKGTSKKRSGRILEELATFYSDTFEAALADYQNKENSKEIRAHADKQMRSIKKAMTNALFISGYVYERKVEHINVNKQGDIVLVTGPNEEDKETFSWNTALKLAKKHYGRTGKGQGREDHESNDDTPTMPLLTAATVIENTVTGKAARDFSGQTKAQLQAAFIALAGMFAADDQGKLNTAEIVRMYNEAA